MGVAAEETHGHLQGPVGCLSTAGQEGPGFPLETVLAVRPQGAGVERHRQGRNLEQGLAGNAEYGG